MGIRLLTVSTAKNTSKILDEITHIAGDELSFVMNFGDMDADVKASSISRMNMKVAYGKQHIMKDTKYTGVLQAVENQGILEQDISEFIDHMFRTDPRYRYRSHNLFSLQDYLDYYHIMLDVISTKVVENNITHMLFFNIPHLGYDTMCYQVGKALGLKMILVTQSLFPNRFFSMKRVEDYGKLDAKGVTYPPVKIEAKSGDWFYMKGIKQGEAKKGSLTLKGLGNIALYIVRKEPQLLLQPKKLYEMMQRVRKIYRELPEWRDPFARFFHRNELEYFEHIIQYEEVSYDLDQPFVYFPMQMQPEMTTSALGGWYRDQALAIESLALMLPENIKIYVKENPKQGAYMRGPLFFHRLKRLENVVIVPSYANTHELTDRSLFVSTVTGTVGWEALQKGKNVLVFGRTWYASFPGAFTYREDLTYEEIVNYKIDHHALEKAYGILLGKSHEGVIDRHYTQLVEAFDETKNIKQTAQTIWKLCKEKEEFTFG